MKAPSEAVIAWTIAGSDSGGGAGVQADLATFHDFDVHGCSVITAITAQNSIELRACVATAVEHVGAQIAALRDDLPPAAIKLGMLANARIVDCVSAFLADYQGFVVCDPVMRASTGGALQDGDVVGAIVALLPRIDLLTPNAVEAEALTGISVSAPADMELAAAKLIGMGARSVLITGGHVPAVQGRCLDYWSNGDDGFFLSGAHIDTEHSHGSGCTGSSAIAALVARGLALVDALVLARAYVGRGIREARRVGRGPGPVGHAGWPEQLADWPGVSRHPGAAAACFPRCRPLGFYPVVDDVSWIERLLPLGVATVQLRIKQAGDEAALREQVERAVALCRTHGAQLFVNDHWQLAIACGAFGVHLGQEDLESADLAAIAAAGLRLGVSTHSAYEIARAHQLRPSYIALGPIYATSTKPMAFAPRGLGQLAQWVRLLGGEYPLTAIGGISSERVPEVLSTGVGSCAVVRAVTEADDLDSTVALFLALHRQTWVGAGGLQKPAGAIAAICDDRVEIGS